MIFMMYVHVTVDGKELMETVDGWTDLSMSLLYIFEVLVGTETFVEYVCV